MYFPTWVDLKGQDSVPETVHHVVGVVIVAMVTCCHGYVLSWLLRLQVCSVDPIIDTSWQSLKTCVKVCDSASLFDNALLCATPRPPRLMVYTLRIVQELGIGVKVCIVN